MAGKALVTLRTPAERETVRGTGVELLADYDDSVLVRATDAQETALASAGLEVARLSDPEIRLSGASFAFASARAADAMAPIAPRDPSRTAYYLVQCVGPIKREWLDAIRGLGGAVHGNMPSFTLIVGATPAHAAEIAKQSWIEGVTSYRPAMKVAPDLRGLKKRSFDANDLARLDMPAAAGDAAPASAQVQVSVFPGESTSAIAAQIRAGGGAVLSENARSVTGLANADTIAALAEREGVQAILPHRYPKLFNNAAAPIMGVPANHLFEGAALDGAGQIVAVADSGLDTGDLTSVHVDVRGRVVGLSSFATPANFAPFINDPPSHDDGTDDRFSAHGTHVTGSVLGNGQAARAAGVPGEPTGLAPGAQLFFQAVEQQVKWKSKAEMIASGITPPQDWPPEESGLYGLPDDLHDLFAPAYAAGARIHTNSWGSSNPSTFQQYDEQARAVDDFMFHHRDILILFAAGNDGVDEDADGVIDSGSISPPGTAKNALTVGASENNRPHGSTPAPGIDRKWDELGPPTARRWPRLGPAGHVSDKPDGMAAFSSRGPTAEGRIKPEIVAPGTNVLSIRSSHFPDPNPLWGDVASGDPLHGLYCWSGGTSMSCPLVAGAAALVRQFLIDRRGHVVPGGKPSGALVKATLVNGAAPMLGQFTGEIPTRQNAVCGFGRVNVGGSVSPNSKVQFDDEPTRAVATGQTRTYRVTVTDTTKPFKATLAWTDAPSLPGNGSLENQLYLQVRTPAGVVLDGDVTPFPTATNNTQQVIVTAPAAGVYEIRVRGVSVTVQSPGTTSIAGTVRQDFAIVASNGDDIVAV